MLGLRKWYSTAMDARRARKAWNGGVPLMSRETAQYASQHHAQHWVALASELQMARLYQYSPHCESIAGVVHKEFWIALMRTHNLVEKWEDYWKPLLAQACMEGNSSVIQAYADVFGFPNAFYNIDGMPLVHPRIIGWEANNGHISKKHVRNMISISQIRPGFSGWDAEEFVLGGPVMLAWVLDWVKLPGSVIDARDGHAFVQYLHGLLEEMHASAGERNDQGLAMLQAGHQYRKTRVWTQVSDLATPIIAGPTLIMLRAVYERFAFEPKLMDAMEERWCRGDLDDPLVAAVVNYMKPNWQSVGAGGSDADSVLLTMLDLQADKNDPFSIYQAALPFFRPELAIAAVAEVYDVGPLVAD